jgi:methyltransferase (TIGR00027 family)
MNRPSTPEGDPDAQKLLCAELLPSLVRRPHIIARTRFIDAQVLAAVTGTIPQVVLCAAGYDDRAVRFWSPGVRFFDVDHPAVHADKGARLRAIADVPGSLVPVPADLRSDDIARALDSADHDAARPSLFVCEGLLVYLHQTAIERLLAGLRSSAAAGSVLAASLAVHPEGLHSGRVTAAANARPRPAGGEPWRTILPESGWLRLLAATGWRASSLVDAASLEPSAPEGTSLLLVAAPV